MKKVLFAIAAIAVGCVMADAIESENVVGFQNKALSLGDFNWFCPTFDQFSATPTLGTIKVNEDFSLSILQITAPSGATQKFLVPSGAKWYAGDTIPEGQTVVEGLFEYWLVDWFGDEVVIGEKKDGWYLRDGDDNLYCMNAIEVPLGRGVMVDAVDNEGEPALVFSGNVMDEDVESTLNLGDFNFLGNCSPKDITLGDVTVNDDFSLSILQFTAASGATQKFLVPSGAKWNAGDAIPEGQQVIEGLFEYWLVDWFGDEVVIGEKVDGWYLRDGDDNLYPVNSISLSAGSGFMIDAVDNEGEPSVIIPSAL